MDIPEKDSRAHTSHTDHIIGLLIAISVGYLREIFALSSTREETARMNLVLRV
jgi:hypothetical protein